MNQTSSTDDEIIQAFQAAAETVTKQGKFGLFGQKGSSFLNKVQGFLKGAQAIRQEEEKSLVDCLPDDLQDIILEYLDEEKSDDEKSHRERYPSLRQHGALFSVKVVALGATKITHDLLRRIEVEKNLQILSKNPRYLTTEIKEVTSRRGQRIQDVTVLQALCMAGACNPRPLRPDEKNYGLVERVIELFPDSSVANQQIAELHSRGFAAATEKTMRPVKKAIDALLEKLKKFKKMPGIDHTLLNRGLLESFAPAFRAALVPDSNYIVRSGFLFDINIFLYFLDQFAKNTRALDDRYDLFGATIYPSLQACTDPGDLELFNIGMHRVLIADEDAPLPSAEGMPKSLDDFFKTSCFDIDGSPCNIELNLRIPVQGSRWCFEKLRQAKTSMFSFTSSPAIKTQCLTM